MTVAAGAGRTGETMRTTCPYCGVGCGVLATPQADGSVAIAGDPDHPANFGKLCSKGAALGETLALDDRLLHPQIAGARASWDEALDLVAARFSQAIAQHGPDSVALYVSGQILTEDYYVANKLMKGFVGTANIDTNSRLCMASSVAGHRRAFGADVVPGTYRDLEEAELVVLVGSNLAWCHPVLHQRLLRAREKTGAKLVVVDPRATASCDGADMHLALAPDSDVALFLGLLARLERDGAGDAAFLRDHVGDAELALALARALALAEIAARTGLDESEIDRFYALWSGAQRVVTVYSQGVNQSTSGSDKVNAIINCHLYAGRIGRPGMGPFSVTGQPNAMGGREVGGLANMLAAHMSLEDAQDRARVQRFWRAPRMAERPGLKAVDLFRAIGEGRVKAVWIMGTNPIDSMPDADAARAALRACPFVVVSDVVRDTDTTACAHVLLPAAAWGEKDGTVTNSERRVSRQRAFLPLPGEARPDWRIVCDAAARMGFSEAFAFADSAAVFREHAALSGFENDGARAFDIGAYAAISRADYDALAPFQWPQRKGEAAQERRFFAQGGFYAPERRARMAPTSAASRDSASMERPFQLNTGRLRDQWHTMTRTGKSTRLMAHAPEPSCDLHPDDAHALGLADGDLVRIEGERGEAVVRARLAPGQRRGEIFAPMHWTDRFSARARINALTSSACDPLSGQPGLKRTDVALRRFAPVWTGFAACARRPTAQTAYWALAPVAGGYRVELAGADEPEDWQAFAAALFGLAAQEPVDWVAYHDRKGGVRRLAAFAGDRLAGALFAGRDAGALSKAFVENALARPHPPQERYRLLAGRPAHPQDDPGPLVCACNGVGAKAIAAAIIAGCATVEAIGETLKAGANCGSCRPEIRRMIHDRSDPARSGDRRPAQAL
jgi:assimilatory nitrate reductase catalytic subunit